MEMERIASFSIDHDKLEPGLYVSREDFGDIVTYDLRFKKPNQGDYLQMEAAHTIEHIFATYIRSCSIGSNVVYFGPMGCMTGFYLILKGVPKSEAIAWVQKGMAFVAAFEGDVPGASRKECGNYRAQSLPGAKVEAKRYAEAIGQWGEKDLEY